MVIDSYVEIVIATRPARADRYKPTKLERVSAHIVSARAADSIALGRGGGDAAPVKRFVIACSLVACKREPEPAMDATPPVPAVASSAAPSASAPVVVKPGTLEVRPGVAWIADPTTGPRMPYEFAIGEAGELRLELVDRIALTHPMELDPRDPRTIFIDEIEVTKPGIVSVVLTFETVKDELQYKVATTGERASTFVGPVDKKRRPSGDVRLTAGNVTTVTALEPGKYLPVGWFVWEVRDAGPAPPPISTTVDEKAKYPLWHFRARFTKKS